MGHVGGRSAWRCWGCWWCDARRVPAPIVQLPVLLLLTLVDLSVRVPWVLWRAAGAGIARALKRTVYFPDRPWRWLAYAFAAGSMAGLAAAVAQAVGRPPFMVALAAAAAAFLAVVLWSVADEP